MKKAAFWAVVIVAVALISYPVLNYFFGSIVEPDKYDDFAKCLTEKNVTMYGTDWCKFCQEQKALFGESFKYINYTNCDFGKDLCIAKKVKGYPSWIINGEIYSGVKSLESLSSLSKCDIK